MTDIFLALSGFITPFSLGFALAVLMRGIGDEVSSRRQVEAMPPCIYCGGEGHWSQECPQ